MKFVYRIIIFLSVLPAFFSCANNTSTASQDEADSTFIKGSYAFDKAFLAEHTKNLVELSSEDGKSRMLVSPEWQGRVMTSTSAGNEGPSYGWINYDLLAQKTKRAQFNPVGGEERFWVGPEGGQYSVFFKQGDSFAIGNWQVPAIIDTVAYAVANTSNRVASFQASAVLTNYSGTLLDITITRAIRLLNKDTLTAHLGILVPGSIQTVAYETSNRITNTGSNDWTKRSGLLSIWLLGMYTPTPQTVVMIPFRPIPQAAKFITSDYFGVVPAGRLKIRDSVLFFTCDGKYRSKIGVSPLIAKRLAASYDFLKNVLTLVIPEVHTDEPYVNSKWALQEKPFEGDVINAYNDGPLADGSQLGPFYEIESSSPALELKRGSSGSYRQVTAHLQASFPEMKEFVQKLLAVDLDELKATIK
jgi:hypothetical protein